MNEEGNDTSIRAETVPPVRVQRKRTKGWQAPALAVYVGRPGIFGNHAAFVCCIKEPAAATAAFRRWVDQAASPAWKKRVREDLRGKDLMCWCPLDQPCHADILLELANGVLP